MNSTGVRKCCYFPEVGTYSPVNLPGCSALDFLFLLSIFHSCKHWLQAMDNKHNVICLWTYHSLWPFKLTGLSFIRDRSDWHSNQWIEGERYKRRNNNVTYGQNWVFLLLFLNWFVTVFSFFVFYISFFSFSLFFFKNGFQIDLFFAERTSIIFASWCFDWNWTCVKGWRT